MKHAYDWDFDPISKRHTDSLCLYQIISAKGKAGMTFLCTPQIIASKSEGQKISYGKILCEKVSVWFYSDFIELLIKEKGLNKIGCSFFRMLSESELEATRMLKDNTIDYCHFIFMIWVNHHYTILIRGEGEILLREKCRNRIRFVRQNSTSKIKKIKGVLNERTSILMALGLFSNKLSKNEITSIFRKENEEEGRMKKILTECNQRIRNSKKLESDTMIWLRFDREDL